MLRIVAPCLVTIAATLIFELIRHSRQRRLQIEQAPPAEQTQTRKKRCAICNKEFSDEFKNYRLPCGHEFHTDCLKLVFSEELKGCRTCPYRDCRRLVPESIVGDPSYR